MSDQRLPIGHTRVTLPPPPAPDRIRCPRCDSPEVAEEKCKVRCARCHTLIYSCSDTL